MVFIKNTFFALLVIISCNQIILGQKVGTHISIQNNSTYLKSGKIGDLTIISKQNNKGNDWYGVIDKDGIVIIPIFCSEIKYDKGEFLVFQHVGVKDESSGYVYIDTMGNHLNTDVYENAEVFNNGYAIVSKINEGPALLNTSGKLTIPCDKNLYAILEYSEGTVLVSPKSGDKFMYVMDTTGKILLKNTELIRLESAVNNGLIMAINEKTRKHGYLNPNGKIVIPFKYDAALKFNEDLAGVMINKKYGFINKNGMMIIPAIYHSVGSFSEGLADIYIGNDTNIKMGFINKLGKIVIPAKYTELNSKFYNGVAYVQINKEDIDVIAIDKSGKLLDYLSSYNPYSYRPH